MLTRHHRFFLLKETFPRYTSYFNTDALFHHKSIKVCNTRLKKILLYLLLFSYATVLLKPVLPLLGDAVAHTFWRMEHISSTHFENGKYHVHFELLQSAKKTDDGNSNPRIEVFATPHIITNINCYNFFADCHVQCIPYTIWQSYLPFPYLQSNYPPPKA